MGSVIYSYDLVAFCSTLYFFLQRCTWYKVYASSWNICIVNIKALQILSVCKEESKIEVYKFEDRNRVSYLQQKRSTEAYHEINYPIECRGVSYPIYRRVILLYKSF